MIDGRPISLHNAFIIVSKNPCYHPGDIRYTPPHFCCLTMTFRVLRVVDVPALHHIHDAIVFPVKGDRPHPNEIAGSDLDGDNYFGMHASFAGLY